LHFLRKGKIRSGQRVLVYGASGAVGTYAVQLARYFGASVIAVCGTAHVDLVRSLGADAVVDYTTTDVTASGQTYDLILDAVGKTTFARCEHLLTREGVYVETVMIAAGLRGRWYALTTGKQVVGGLASQGISPAAQREALRFLGELVAAGRITPVIDRRYPLAQMVAAHRYVEKGHKTGNVVIDVSQ
jgi:NADPH:quinone reductase-like Zn-dependent oxidoreductase